MEQLLKEADLVVLAVNHQQFSEWNPAEVARINPRLAIFDAVNGWRKEPWEMAGLIYRGLAKK
jgi:UDP-N-acetyl-D-mannosaminuronate dehydrogenase